MVTYTSVTSRPTRCFSNEWGHFQYRTISRSTGSGSVTLPVSGEAIVIAEGEQALLDLWYLEGGEWTPQRMETMRFSTKSEKSIREAIRFWRIHTWTGSELSCVAEEINPRIRGWLNYYGKFRRSSMSGICDMLQTCLVKWAKCKYGKLKGSWNKADAFLSNIALQKPKYFVHWEWAVQWNG